MFHLRAGRKGLSTPPARPLCFTHKWVGAQGGGVSGLESQRDSWNQKECLHDSELPERADVVGVRTPLLLGSQSRQPPISLLSRTEPASSLPWWMCPWTRDPTPWSCGSTEGRSHTRHTVYNVDTYRVHLQAPAPESQEGSGADWSD